MLLAGYSRCDQVEGQGQFAVRGGLLDVFSPSLDKPVRCEFFGDEIDELFLFDKMTQRRTERLDQVTVVPRPRRSYPCMTAGRKPLSTSFSERATACRIRREPSPSF
jgi:transcription-repair coupling factor (superfamily II helicase)